LPQAQSHEIKPNIAIPYGYIVVFIQFAAIQVKKLNLCTELLYHKSS